MEHAFTEQEITAALARRHGEETQRLLSLGRVAIAGLGGLGSNIAFALARIGVGHLHLIDFDRVDLTNLNRQQYFMEHVGIYKTDALRSELLRINPYLDIRTDCVRWSPLAHGCFFIFVSHVCAGVHSGMGQFQPWDGAMAANGIRCICGCRQRI